ncbi:DUF5008 domain-containing protein [Parapedobacter sp. 10938]|uniref:DUF5008 domain-containing protein n=1 Tax=Parapedobacter flavus TaxID=3110225 RepID=UPI002DB97915|nr:DUF5008 domain-containing protein [Parapedobacter sp. 10938]MEC3881117.1 DUF5008 domain-containing protein [Parapedobacter sp. 10938]
MKKMNNPYRLVIGVMIGLISVLSCKEDIKFFGEPYEPGKEGVGISIDRTRPPVPASGEPGTVIAVEATGLLPYKDQLIFRFNGEQGEIQEVTEEGIKVMVPTFASTGVLSISVDDVVVFGPEFDVEGNVRIDPTFAATQGANGQVADILFTNDGKMLVVGGFNNYDNKGTVRPINRIASAFLDGAYDPSFRSGIGTSGFISSIVQLDDKYFIGGSFSDYAQQRSNISNITMLNSNGTIDTMGIDTWRRPDQEDTTQYFSRFNGGVHGGGIGKVYNQDNKLLVTGAFRYYVSRQYDKANRLETRDTVIIDSIEMRQLVRFNRDGTLDKTYRYDESTNKSPIGANAAGVASIYHEEGALAGKLLIYGQFSKFDDRDVGRILRLNADGTIDETFNAGQTGFDFDVYEVTYNKTTRKYMVCGYFRSYNGTPVGQIVLLNEDGSLDDSFQAKTFTNGNPTYARQLANGLVFVSGNFQQYGGVVRNGIMFLDAAGNLAEGYNNIGTFRGSVSEVFETRSADNKPALLIIGFFDQFNGEPAHNILRILLD